MDSQFVSGRANGAALSGFRMPVGWCPICVGVWLILTNPLPLPAQTNLSTWAFPGPGGRLLHQPDALGNRILDYSGVGYKGGTAPIPDVTVKTNLSPVAGVDNGPRIQGAINYVATLPLVNGFRGTVFLNAGEYAISNSITISASGIVLRGAGEGTNGTILRAAGPRPTAAVDADHAPLIIVSGSGSASTTGTARNITNNYVPVGARSFNVDSTNGLTVGSRVMITRPSPANWIHDIGMDLVSPAWTAGGFNVLNERFITRIEGNRIILDAPLTCALETQYGNGTIQAYAWSGRITNVGIEDLRGISDFDPSVTTNTGASAYYYSDELHALDFIEADTVENAWMRRVTSQYFGYACVHLTGGTRAVTVSDCDSLDPVSIITGGRRYAFSLADARHCLVQNCYTRSDRHQFVTDSLNTGPNVFLDGVSDNAYADAGPHFRWGTGAIWDNVTVNGDYVDIRNRGNAGTSHGWAGANEVVWNSKADAFIVESPPTARNWLIGSIGPLAANTMAVGPHPDGTYDSRNTNVFPNSLYYAQLQDRMIAPSLQTREYWLGVIDAFTNSLPGGEKVYIDTAWSNAVKSAAGGQPLDGFDVVTNNHWIPFSFSFALGVTDRVAVATLSLAMRATNSAATNTLYLGALTNAFSFTNLGWQSIGLGTNTTVRVLDLTSQLNTLTNGLLNVAVRGDLGIDWAMLELQIAPVQTLVTNPILPSADAFVRGGANAGINYGTNTTLDIKLDSTASNTRQAYMRWNLAGYSTRLQSARIRLTPVSVGTNGLEHGITLANSNTWNQNTVTWNSQPGGGKRFATWIPSTNGPAEFIVTPQVQAVLAAGGQLSLELFSLNNLGASGLVSYASSKDANPANRPQLLLVYSNALPAISKLSDRAMPANTNTGALPFTVGDPGYAANLLTLGVLSANTNLVTPGGFSFGGSLSNRTVTVTPVPGQMGIVLITLIVTNPAGLTAGSQFTLSVTNAVNTNSVPTISPLSDRSIAVNTNTGPISFTVSDVLYDPGALSVGAVSSNLALVPTEAFLFGGAGSNRTLTVVPALTRTGSALITVTVTNPGGATDSSQFTLTVTNGGGTTPSSGSWAVDANGDWNNPINWSGGIIATGADLTATFAIDATASRYVNNNSPRTIGNLVLSDSNPGSAGAWFITNSVLTLQVSNGTPAILVSNVAATITSVLDGEQGLAVSGNGTLVLGGANTFGGPAIISAGALRAANDYALGATSAGTIIGNDPTARLELAGDVTVAEPITVNCKGSVNGSVPAVVNVGGANTIAGTISLTTGGSYWTFEAAAGKLRVTGNTTNMTTVNVRTLWLRGEAEGEWLSAIGDSAADLATAIRKDDSGTWVLAGDNTCTGNTVVSNGTLRVNGTLPGGAVTVYGGMLAGTGTITAPVTIYAGAAFGPGGSLGTLRLNNNLLLSAGSSTAVEIDATSLACGSVQGLSNVVYAGTLSVTTAHGSLAGGQSFRIFNAASYSGGFSNIMPESPGVNLSWAFNPTNGTLSVFSLAPPVIRQFGLNARSNFTLSGTGPAGQVYRIFTTTNLGLPMGSWTALTTGILAGGSFAFTDPQTTNYGYRFYRVTTP